MYIAGFFYILQQLYLNKNSGNILSKFISWRAKSKVYLLFAVFTHLKIYGDLLYILEQLYPQQMSVCFQFPNAFIGGQVKCCLHKSKMCNNCTICEQRAHIQRYMADLFYILQQFSVCFQFPNVFIGGQSQRKLCPVEGLFYLHSANMTTNEIIQTMK